MSLGFTRTVELKIPHPPRDMPRSLAPVPRSFAPMPPPLAVPVRAPLQSALVSRTLIFLMVLLTFASLFLAGAAYIRSANIQQGPTCVSVQDEFNHLIASSDHGDKLDDGSKRKLIEYIRICKLFIAVDYGKIETAHLMAPSPFYASRFSIE